MITRIVQRFAAIAALVGAAGTGGAWADEHLPAVNLETVVTGLVSPVALASPPGFNQRFVVDRTGTIHLLEADGELRNEPLLDISGQLVDLRPSFDERGLLGLAFHPDFEDNGRYFVYYSAPLRDEAPANWDHTSIVAEFRARLPDDDPAAPFTTVDGSKRVVMRIDQPQFNHNGGSLSFGPDGYLYIALGDGGGANDVGIGHPPAGNGQTTTTLLGSILRIDVDSDRQAYAIPEGNPFVGQEAGLDEIYS